jgi:hypothetical protein
MLECDVTDGRLISFIESSTRVRGREFLDGHARFVVTVGQQMLAELKRNPALRVGG